MQTAQTVTVIVDGAKPAFMTVTRQVLAEEGLDVTTLASRPAMSNPPPVTILPAGHVKSRATD